MLDDSAGSLGAKPPPIPPCQMAERWSRGEHLLFWVFAGHASVRLANGEVYPLGAGEDYGCLPTPAVPYALKPSP